MVVQCFNDHIGSVVIDLHDLSHGAFSESYHLSQFFSCFHSGGVDFRQCCRKSTVILIAKILPLPCFRPALDFFSQFQRNFAKLPGFQISPSPLGLYHPLLRLQQILESEDQHTVGDIVFLADLLAVVSVHDGHIFVDHNGGITAVGQKVRFQRRTLLLTQRREQRCQLIEHMRFSLRAEIFNSGVLHQAVASSPGRSAPSSTGRASVLSAALLGERKSMDLALTTKRTLCCSGSLSG